MPAGKYMGILAKIQTIVNKKMIKNELFFGSTELVDLSRVYVRFSWWDIGGLSVLFENLWLFGV